MAGQGLESGQPTFTQAGVSNRAESRLVIEICQTLTAGDGTGSLTAG